MKTLLKFFLHLYLGITIVNRFGKSRPTKHEKRLFIQAKPLHLNRYLLNAANRLPNGVYIQLNTSIQNLTQIGKLKRSGQLGSELLWHPRVMFSNNKTADLNLDIDFFQNGVKNRLPIWRHPKFTESYDWNSEKKKQIIFAGSQRNEYRGFNHSLWAMPNRLEQIEFVAEHVPDIQIHNWIPSNEVYAKLLSKSSHFLCLPGYRMPLCHNLYECIEFGCVPIIHSSYHAWLEPELQKATQFFTYACLEELKSLVSRIISGDLDKKTEVAQNIIRTWIDDGYGVESIINQAQSCGKLLLCAEEISVSIHEDRTR